MYQNYTTFISEVMTPPTPRQAGSGGNRPLPAFPWVRRLELASVHPVLTVEGYSGKAQLTFLDSETKEAIPLEVSLSTHSRSVLRRFLPQLLGRQVSLQELRKPYELLESCQRQFYHAVVVETDRGRSLKIESLVPNISKKTIYN